jgi:nicotinamide mononucleotide (NMN) deamidase PncC
MALGAMRKAGADVAIAVSGNAGPTAAEGEPPVGTVCIALARRGAPRPVHTETLHLPGMPRNAIRNHVATKVLQLLAAI